LYLTSVRFLPERFPSHSTYPFNVPALAATRELAFGGRVSFFAGDNGCGKSTLLEAIARGCGIHIWGPTKQHRVHANPHESQLFEYLHFGWDPARCLRLLLSLRVFLQLRIGPRRRGPH